MVMKQVYDQEDHYIQGTSYTKSAGMLFSAKGHYVIRLKRSF